MLPPAARRPHPFEACLKSHRSLASPKVRGGLLPTISRAVGTAPTRRVQPIALVFPQRYPQQSLGDVAQTIPQTGCLLRSGRLPLGATQDRQRDRLDRDAAKFGQVFDGDEYAAQHQEVDDEMLIFVEGGCRPRRKLAVAPGYSCPIILR